MLGTQWLGLRIDSEDLNTQDNDTEHKKTSTKHKSKHRGH